MSNKVLITNDQNVVKVPSGLRILIRRSCNAVLDFEHFDGPAEISVTFVDNNRIHELNKEYRDKDSATDVLSFPLGENGEYDIDGQRLQAAGRHRHLDGARHGAGRAVRPFFAA